MIVEIIVFLVTTIVGYYIYAYKRVHSFFEKRGIKYIPGVPVFGNIMRSTFLRRHVLEDIDAIYKAFPDEKYVGYIEGTNPIFMIRDPEVIKAITVKDFEHFINHRQFFEDFESVEPLFAASLLMLKGEKWRDMRTTLSPAFTGSKMRHMMPFMMDISDNIINYLKDHTNENINVDDLMRRYTNDVIASAGFGLQVNSLVDKNEFYTTGQELFKFSKVQRAKFIFAAQFPGLVKKMGIKIFPRKTIHFFRNLVSSTIEYRKKSNVFRPDMIQLLMEASEGTLNSDNEGEEKDIGFATVQEVLKPQEATRKWTSDEITAQVFIFFIAGFESSANVLVMTVHELAINPKVQEKFYQEIKQFQEAKGKLNYDNIGELKYLDCVLNETSRKWSPAIFLDRVCHKAYALPPPREGGKPCMINSGDIVYNVVNSLHMDPKYFTNPEVFDPERFSEENKRNIKPFTFMPFGVGPRNCIGSRFALLELKVMLYNLVLNYKILKTEKTCDPLRLKPLDFPVRAAGDTWVKFEPRN